MKMPTSNGTNKKKNPGSPCVLSNTEYSVRTAVCITSIKRTFILTFGMTLMAMFVMYSSSGQLQLLTMTKVNSSYYRPFVFTSTRDSYRWNTSLQQRNVRTHSTSLQQHNTSATYKQINRTLGNIKDANGHKGNIEFPGMPDPCSKPRRTTGVEDILCMQRPTFLPNYKTPCWMDRGRLRCLPYFHLFGVCKSGTSDLFKRIYLHPEIVANKGIFGKEVWYWSWKRFSRNNRAGIVNLGMTLKEFTNQFYADRIQGSVTEEGFHRLITVEESIECAKRRFYKEKGHGDPMDFWDRFNDERTPQNIPGADELLWTTPYSIRHINPNVKLLLMLRDPIERLYSHYFHSGSGTSAQTFDEHIRYSIPLWKQCLQQHTMRSCIYNRNLKEQLKAPIYTSFYVVHMREWLKVFPREQILIFRNEDYTSDMRGTLQNIFQFLDVAPPDASMLDKMTGLPHFYETKGKTRAGPMFASTRKLLVDLYKPYTEELAVLLGDDRFAFRDKSFG